MLAIAPRAPVMSLLAMSSCSNTTAATMTSATMDGPNATLSSSRAWRVPTGLGVLPRERAVPRPTCWGLSTGWAAPRASSRARSGRTRGPDYDGGGPDWLEDDGCAGTCVVGALIDDGASLDDCGRPYVGNPVGGVGGPPWGPAENPPVDGLPG